MPALFLKIMEDQLYNRHIQIMYSLNQTILEMSQSAFCLGELFTLSN